MAGSGAEPQRELEGGALDKTNHQLRSAENAVEAPNARSAEELSQSFGARRGVPGE